MKSAITFALVTISVTQAAMAAPALVLDTSISVEQVPNSLAVLASPRITVESGKQATVQLADKEFSVTPKLLDDGQVEFQVIWSEAIGQQTRIVASPRLVTLLGKEAELRVGKTAFRIKASLAK